MGKAARDSIGVAPRDHYFTPLGLTDQRPNYPQLNRAALMRDAHRVAATFRPHYATYAEALAYGLRAAWAQAKVVREFQSLRVQVAPVQHTAAQIEASRQAPRRTGSSLWAC